MGWTIYYEASSEDGNIDRFVASANESKVKLSRRCEDYWWRVESPGSARGFTKVEFSKQPQSDFVTILRELRRVADQWPGVRVLVADDYYIAKAEVRSVDIDEVVSRLAK